MGDLPVPGGDPNSWGTKLNTFLTDIPVGSIAGALGAWVPIYDPRNYGAACDGVTDDLASMQLTLDAIAATSRSGGTLIVPSHTRVVGTLYVRSENVRVSGFGRRNLQTVPLDLTLASAPPTIIHESTGPLFKLSHSYPINGFSVRDVTLAHSGSRTTDTIALDFDLAGDGAFARDFLFDNISVTGFYSSFALRASSTEGSGSSGQLGAVRIVNSNIMHNLWIAQCRDGKWINGFYFERCDAGQNGYDPGYGGLSVTGHNINILHNILEGQRNPVSVRGVSGRGLCIVGNYFEANVGDACVWVGSQNGPFEIGPNFYGNVMTTHKMLLDAVGGGRCVDRWWPSQVAKTHPLPNAIVSTYGGSDERHLLDTQIADKPYVFFDAPSPVYLDLPKGAATVRADVPASPVPAPSAFGSVGQIPVSSATMPGTGRVSYTYTGYSGVSGEIIVATFLYRISDARGYYPVYVQISPDGNQSNGYDGAAASEVYYFTDDEWRVLTVGCVAKADWTSLTIGLYPYGLNAPGVAGKVSLHRPPTVYKAASADCVQPYIYSPFSAPAIPSGGSWKVGDRIVNSAPAAGGAFAWCCTVAGSPGTWKAINLEV